MLRRRYPLVGPAFGAVFCLLFMSRSAVAVNNYQLYFLNPSTSTKQQCDGAGVFKIRTDCYAFVPSRCLGEDYSTTPHIEQNSVELPLQHAHYSIFQGWKIYSFQPIDSSAFDAPLATNNLTGYEIDHDAQYPRLVTRKDPEWGVETAICQYEDESGAIAASSLLQQMYYSEQLHKRAVSGQSMVNCSNQIPLIESSMPTSLNLSDYTANGVEPGGGNGTLNSCIWSVIGNGARTGHDNLDVDFGEGDLNPDGSGEQHFRTGQKTNGTGILSGGLYYYEDTDGAKAIWIQPIRDLFTPGVIKARFKNNINQTLTQLEVKYRLYRLHDKNRGVKVRLGYSVNGDLRCEFGDDDMDCPPVETTLDLERNRQLVQCKRHILSGFNLPQNAIFVLHWQIDDDKNKKGQRDEVGIGSVQIATAFEDDSNCTLVINPASSTAVMGSMSNTEGSEITSTDIDMFSSPDAEMSITSVTLVLETSSGFFESVELSSSTVSEREAGSTYFAGISSSSIESIETDASSTELPFFSSTVAEISTTVEALTSSVELSSFSSDLPDLTTVTDSSSITETSEVSPTTSQALTSSVEPSSFSSDLSSLTTVTDSSSITETSEVSPTTSQALTSSVEPSSFSSDLSSLTTVTDSSSITETSEVSPITSQALTSSVESSSFSSDLSSLTTVTDSSSITETSEVSPTTSQALTSSVEPSSFSSDLPDLTTVADSSSITETSEVSPTTSQALTSSVEPSSFSSDLSSLTTVTDSSSITETSEVSPTTSQALTSSVEPSSFSSDLSSLTTVTDSSSITETSEVSPTTSQALTSSVEPSSFSSDLSSLTTVTDSSSITETSEASPTTSQALTSSVEPSSFSSDLSSLTTVTDSSSITETSEASPTTTQALTSSVEPSSFSSDLSSLTTVTDSSSITETSEVSPTTTSTGIPGPTKSPASGASMISADKIAFGVGLVALMLML